MPLAVSAQSTADAPADSISSETLAKVAKAAAKVEQIRRKYDRKIRNSYNQDRKRSLRQKMFLQIDRTLVKVEGLTPERYEEIMEAAESDNALKEKIRSLAEKKNQKAK